jgi:hypothetical protein
LSVVLAALVRLAARWSGTAQRGVGAYRECLFCDRPAADCQ